MDILSRDANGKVQGVTNVAKMISAIFGVVAIIFSGYLYLTSSMTAIAKDVSTYIEQKTIKTFEEKEKEIRLEQQAIQEKIDNQQRIADLQYLEDLRDHKFLLSKQVEEDPNNDLLKDRLKRVIDKIGKLETKIYE